MDSMRFRSRHVLDVLPGPMCISAIFWISVLSPLDWGSAWGLDQHLLPNKTFYGGPPHNGYEFSLRSFWNSLDELENPAVTVIENAFLVLEAPVVYAGDQDPYYQTGWRFHPEWHGVWFSSVNTEGLCQTLSSRVEFTTEKPFNRMDYAFEPDSGYGLLVWQMGGRPMPWDNDYYGHEIYGYVLDASGKPIEGPFFIASPGDPYEVEPRVAATSSGHFVVTYRRYTAPAGDPWSGWNEPGQQAACARGVHVWYAQPTVSPELVIEVEGFQADVARLDDDRVVVTYVFMDRVTDTRGLKAVVLNHAPYIVAPPITLASSLGGNTWNTENGPAIACNETDHRAVILFGANPGSLGPTNMRVHALVAAVTPSNGLMSTTLDYGLHQLATGSGMQQSPAIAWDKVSGHFLAVWREGTPTLNNGHNWQTWIPQLGQEQTRILVRQLDKNGAAKNATFVAAESGPSAAFYTPAVAAYNSRGLVVWQRCISGQSTTRCRLFQLDVPGPVVAADLDRSGRLDAVDVQQIVNAVLGITAQEQSDPDYSGAFDALDVQLVINGVLGIVIDADGDGLSDAAENNLGTMLDKADTDGDGVNDGPEILGGANPLTNMGFPAGIPVLSPAVLEFGVGLSELHLALDISDSKPREWAVPLADVPDWLHLSAWEGFIEPGKPTPLMVNVDRSSLAPGLYKCTLPVLSPVGTSLISIHMRVGGSEPILEVGPSPVILDTANPVGILRVSNVGGDVLDWSIQQNLPAWLSAVPASGSLLPWGEEIVELTRNPAGLSPGEFSHTLCTASNGGADLVQVRMQVEAAEPILFLSGESLLLPPPLEIAAFVLENRGGDTLAWAVQPDMPDWMAVTPMSGYLSTGEMAAVEVHVDRSGLDSGDYEHTISISSDGGHATVQVTMGVPPPSFGVTPVEVNFGRYLDEADVSLTNAGGGTLVWSIEGVLPDWLRASPMSGELPMNASANLHLEVLRAGLPMADYAHDLVLTSNDANVIVSLQMSVVHP